jgi:glucans biosynthesis protein C
MRHLAFDNLRALAMLAGVVFHAALAHSPLVAPVFPTSDRALAAGLDAVLWPLHLVRMPVFFVLAGFFACLSLQRRGMAGFMRERARRLLVPLLVLVPLFHWLMAELVLHAARTAERPGPLLLWLRGVLASGEGGSLPPGTGHLWFLYYLLLLCVLLWVARVLLPLGAKAWLRGLPLGVWAFGLPLLCALSFASVSAPHPAPESLLPQFWALAVFGGFFAFGFVAGPKLAELAQPHRLLLHAAAGGLACAAFLTLLWPLRLQAGWLLGLASACASVWLSFALLGLAQRALAFSTPWLRYLADAAYWVYLAHLPVLFALQFAWLDWAAPWFVKLPLTVAGTLAVCLLSFECLVKRGLLGRWLLGRQPGRAIATTP